MLKYCFTEAVELGTHVQLHPRDLRPITDLEFPKDALANKRALLRLDAHKIGFDQACLRRRDTIEKEAMIGNNSRKEAKRRAVDLRKELPWMPSEDDVEET